MFIVLHKAGFLNLNKIAELIIAQIKIHLENNKCDNISFFLSQFINKKNKEGLTAMHFASFRGNIKMITLLYENGGDVLSLTNKGSTMMHFAAMGNQQTSLVYFKERFKMDIMSLDYNECTPLHIAAENGSDIALAFLLSWNVNPNVQDKKGLTPLHYGVINGREKIIKKLLQKGADVHIRDYNRNKSSVDYSRDSRNAKIISLFKERNICEILFFRPKIAKTKHSKINMLLFIILHVFISVITSIFILPFFNNYVSSIYLIWLLLVFGLYTLLASSEPGQLKHKSERSIVLCLEEGDQIANYCPYCSLRKTPTTKHCIICDICVDGFDHHCFWVGNCVGKGNYFIFCVFLVIENLFVLFHFILSIIST